MRFIAVCIQCSGRKATKVPFDSRTDRILWADTHINQTGHSVILLNEKKRP